MLYVAVLRLFKGCTLLNADIWRGSGLAKAVAYALLVCPFHRGRAGKTPVPRLKGNQGLRNQTLENGAL